MADAALKDYLNSIARYPLLTPQQEIQLARRVSRMRELKAATHELSAAEQREIRSGDKARNQFMQSNLQLVVHVAKKYERSRRKSLEIMDLIQEGNIGLARAVELFDHTRGYKFSTYAYWWIKQGIHRALSQSDNMIRIPTGMHELLYKINRANQTLSQRHCRAPTANELADEVGITVAALHTTIRQSAKVVSFDVLIHDDGGSMLDIIADPNTAEINERIELNFETQEMMKMFDEYLDEQTRFIIQSRLLDKPMSWGEMARQTKVSPTRLQQLERRGILRLRALLRDPLDNTPLGNLQCPQSN
jgi:RNA polymerase primary sigma factor